jgi:hypothetical protein
MSPATPLLLTAILLASTPVLGSEICDYAGRTDYSGIVGVRAEAASARDRTRVRVALRFTGTTMIIFHVEYLTEEISEWRNGELQSVALNIRYMVNDRIIRQQWDYFDRGTDGFAAYRAQGKRAEDFRRRYPAFSRYWNPSTFGEPWLAEYRSAGPERRPDLDLKNQVIPAGLRPPLAFAFYWSRTLPPIGQTVPLFLPGNKRQPRIDLSIPPPEPRAGEQRLWRVPVHLEAMRTSDSALATALMSANRHLLQITFDVRSGSGTARGQISQMKCEGQ